MENDRNAHIVPFVKMSLENYFFEPKRDEQYNELKTNRVFNLGYIEPLKVQV